MGKGRLVALLADSIDRGRESAVKVVRGRHELGGVDPRVARVRSCRGLSARRGWAGIEPDFERRATRIRWVPRVAGELRVQIGSSARRDAAGGSRGDHAGQARWPLSTDPSRVRAGTRPAHSRPAAARGRSKTSPAARGARVRRPRARAVVRAVEQVHEAARDGGYATTGHDRLLRVQAASCARIRTASASGMESSRRRAPAESISPSEAPGRPIARAAAHVHARECGPGRRPLKVGAIELRRRAARGAEPRPSELARAARSPCVSATGRCGWRSARRGLRRGRGPAPRARSRA